MSEEMKQLKPIEIPDGLIPGDLDLTTVDGNAFMVMGAVGWSLRRAGNSQEVIDAFHGQAMAGDYDHLLRTAIAFTEPADA
jgi:hypothetical protein